MAAYLNKKQEQFCYFVAQGSSNLEAYELAGYEPSSSNASTLAAKPQVKARIEELRTESRTREAEFRLLMQQAEAAPNPNEAIRAGLEWTFQRVMDMMGENVRLAQVAGEYKAANECLKLMGDAMKMFDKAAGAADAKQLPAGGNLTLIGKVVQQLEGMGEDAEDNALAPRRGK